MRTLTLLCLVAVVPSAAALVAPPPAPPPKPSPRLQKLQQLTFDRRPSAILKAWAPAAPAKDDKQTDPLDAEMQGFQRHVTLGNWPAVKAYLAGLPRDEGKAAYAQLLRSLQSNPMMPGRGGPGMPGMEGMGGAPMNPAMMQFAERHQLSPDDLVALAAVAPLPLEKEHLDSLGAILRQALTATTVVQVVIERLKKETAKPTGAVLTVRQAAKLLTAAGEAAVADVFLPSLEQARKDNDLEALNLLGRHYLGKHARDSKLTLLEQAWAATQSALAVAPTADNRPHQEEALRQAVELAPRLRAEMGQRWLAESFTKEPQRGMTILGTIGALASQGLTSQPTNPDGRAQTLKLMKTAVEALLKASPQRAAEWQDTITLLALCWLREGEFSQRFAEGSGAARMRRDRFGNIFWWDDEFGGRRMMPQNPNQPRPISVVNVLEARPDPTWLARVRADLRPKLAMVLCQLHLKADEENKAFPYIEELAAGHRTEARALVREFLEVWTRNHDPNAARRYTNPYMWMYGFERRAEGIPLTRSKQERNLDELSKWVARLRKLPVGDIDEALLARAFTACHSSAEVYRSEAIEKVFGRMGQLKPKTLAGLAQQMRENLAGVWRRPEEQKDKKTNRKAKDIQSEVLRGYTVARKTVDETLKKFPDDWSLVLARAALLHDEVNYHAELKKSAEHGPRKLAAYKEFERAARLYAAKVKDLPEDEQSTRVYEQWLYASLGAVDLGQITEDKVPDLNQPLRIKAMLDALPGELATKHRDRFANLLFNRLSAVKPQIKFRYLKAGFLIIGEENQQAAEAKKVFDYYADLVREIKLEARIDGPSAVGHQTPFGVFVWLVHTRDIERESGGFGRYLQNQNTGMYWSYNYGRPTADYRDRFQTAATEALKEHFDVLSVTFETDKVHSRAAAEYGWRVTPYAYLLLKARGPQVDRLPPLRIDLDFLDTSGYVVLPVESPAVALDARRPKGAPRPATKLELTQILDERQADKGKLLVEVKATAQGLVPELEQILDLAPPGFKVAKVADQGVSVSKFQPESDTIAIASERTWVVTLEARSQAAPTFAFGEAKVDGTKMRYQRYDDADLVEVASAVDLEARYGGRGRLLLWWGAGAAALVVVGLAVVWAVALRGSRRVEESKWQLPAPLTPFTAIALLERIRDEGGLGEAQKQEIADAIDRLERHYFAQSGNGQVDLQEVVQGWVRQAR